MDEKKLAEWEALAKAARPGPWAPWYCGAHDGLHLLPEEPRLLPHRCANFDEATAADYAFIAAARTAVPELLAEVRALTALLEATYLPLSIRELRRTQGTAAAAKQWEEQSHAYLAGLQKERDDALAEAAQLREKVDHWNRVTLAAITQAKAEASRAMRERCAKLLQGTTEDSLVGPTLSADYRKALLDSAAVLRALPDEP